MSDVFVIKHKVKVQGVSVRRTAREMGVSRNTVRRYLTGAEPGVRRKAVRPSPVRDKAQKRIEEILAESPRWTGGKQRLTAARLHEMVIGEGLRAGYSLVKEIHAEWRRRRQEVFIPLVYAPGDLAEIDFFEVLVDVSGVRQKAWLFLMRLMHSGRDFAWIYARQDQVCFLDGHVRAFQHFGGVPRRCLYDNLRPAVAKILAGSERALTARFAALATHYLFEPCFARPATGHDKGGVESRGRAVRLQHLVPIPSGPDLEAINGELLARLDAKASMGSIAEKLTAEQPALLPVSDPPFVPEAVHFVEVTRRSLVALEGAAYSVPSPWARLQVTARVGAHRVEIIGPDGVAHHPRVKSGQKSIDYRHYLRELRKKPQAVRQVAAELVQDLGEPFARAWQRLVDEHGPKDAARAFAKILDVIVERGEQVVSERILEALVSGEPILLALRPSPPSTEMSTDAIPVALQMIEIATSCAADYDTVLLDGAR
jgi:transposase